MDKKYEFSRMIYSDKSIKKMDKKVKMLGSNSKIRTIDFINFRVFSFLILFFVILYTSSFGYILAPLISIGYYFLLEHIVIDSEIKKRQVSMEGEAITFFEILTLALDAGRNLESAIRVTVDNTNGLLAVEFREVLREVQYGKSLYEAMMDIQSRIPSDSINNIILSLMESDIYGNSIIENLNGQIDYLREKRKMEVKAMISKVPIKISIVSVLFFVPLVLLIILAPVLLSYIS